MYRRLYRIFDERQKRIFSFLRTISVLFVDVREMFRGRSLTLLLLSRLLLVSCVNDDIMVRDYFAQKGVSRVVGFACGNLESERKYFKIHLEGRVTRLAFIISDIVHAISQVT